MVGIRLIFNDSNFSKPRKSGRFTQKCWKRRDWLTQTMRKTQPVLLRDWRDRRTRRRRPRRGSAINTSQHHFTWTHINTLTVLLWNVLGASTWPNGRGVWCEHTDWGRKVQASEEEEPRDGKTGWFFRLSSWPWLIVVNGRCRNPYVVFRLVDANCRIVGCLFCSYSLFFQKKAKAAAATGGLVVGHDKELFLGGSEQILVLQDKSEHSPSICFAPPLRIVISLYSSILYSSCLLQVCSMKETSCWSIRIWWMRNAHPEMWN